MTFAIYWFCQTETYHNNHISIESKLLSSCPYYVVTVEETSAVAKFATFGLDCWLLLRSPLIFDPHDYTAIMKEQTIITKGCSFYFLQASLEKLFHLCFEGGVRKFR